MELLFHRLFPWELFYDITIFTFAVNQSFSLFTQKFGSQQLVRILARYNLGILLTFTFTNLRESVIKKTLLYKKLALKPCNRLQALPDSTTLGYPKKLRLVVLGLTSFKELQCGQRARVKSNFAMLWGKHFHIELSALENSY